MRVALVTSSYTYIQDGVALTLNRLVAFLEARGVAVLVFTPVPEPPAFPCHGELVEAPSLPLPFRPDYRLTLGLPAQARARLEAFAPDIIHIATPDILGHAALAAGRRMGVPVVASYHTRYETYLEHYGLALMANLLTARLSAFYRECREVYVPSTSMAEVLRRQGVEDNVRLWPRGVDTLRFDPARRSPAWRVAAGFEAGDLLLLFASRLVKEKRLATLVEMFRMLEGWAVPHRALVVGDGPERAALTAALPKAVFTGFLEGDALAVAYASSDLFVFPSDTETFGSVTLEAMASGLPTLCADATGSRSLVDPGVTGFLAPASDGAAFARHAAQLGADPRMRRRMGAAARAHSLRFSWEAALTGLLARYETIVAGEELVGMGGV